MHHYEIIPLEGIILQTFIGNVSINDVEELYANVRNDKNFSNQFSMITDFRNSHLKITLEEIKLAASYYKERSKLLGKRAILVNKSIDTAKLLTFCDYLKPEIYFSVYSTVDCASSFMGVNLDRYLEEDISIREDVYI